MAEVILMPRLSDTMTEGVIADWHKKVGDTVKKGDLLAEIETDKATMELESYKDGVLLHLGVDKGGKLQVNDLLAIVGEKDEDISALLKEHESGKEAEEPEKKSEQPTEEKETSKQKKSESEKKANEDSPGDEKKEPSVDISKKEEVVLMPRLSDTMTEGVIASWQKKVGDNVKKGDVLAEIETDKATMELESYKTGTLLYIGAKEGEKIAVNELLCIIGEKDKVDVDAIVHAAKGGEKKSGAGSREPGAEQAQKETSQQTKQPATNDDELETGSSLNGDERVKASPLAKKMAKEKGIDISKIRGSGDGGRIIKSDVDSFKPPVQPEKKSGITPLPKLEHAKGEEGYTDISLSQIRTVIAKRLAESKFSAPHFYLTIEINMDNAISARTQLNEVNPVKISFNDIIVKAAALALREHPAVNASWMGDKIRRYHHIHIGIAVAIEDGLIVPVIRFADMKTLPQIAVESKELSGKARSKKLKPEEFSGNTFTISNLGMMDIDEFTAIINPPDSCIMAVGKIKEIVARKGESFAATNVMKVTMSCDHRSVDGATGATFLQTFKKYMENPVAMFL